MKKVGITTLYHNTINYGGALQAYALQKKVEELGCKCKIIDCYSDSKQSKIERFKAIGWKRALEILRMKVEFKINFTFNKEISNGMSERRLLFKKFLNEIPHTEPVEIHELDKLKNEFDICITGSDQVWHPGIWNDAYLLRFTRGKKASYAASIGATELTTDQAAELAQALKSYCHVTVRENGALEIVQKLTNLPVTEILDPTFLYDGNQWGKIANQILSDEPYAFMYAIGNEPSYRKNVYDFCKRNHLKLISIPFNQAHFKKEDIVYTDKAMYAVGPKEWLGLIKNAKVVFTDSFHGTAFCVQFNKIFWSFESYQNCGEKSKKRIYSLLSKFGLENRIIDFREFPADQKVLAPVDYSQFHKKIPVLRDEAEQYLKEVIHE